MNKSNSTSEFSQINIYVLGRVRVERDSKEIQLSTRKTESLLCYLALNPESHAREKLAALFWGDSSDTEARNSLRNALAVINKKLGNNFLMADRQSVKLNPEYPFWIDAVAFESQATEYLDDPIPDPNQFDADIYQTDLMSDFYDEWIFPLREYYRSLFLETLLQLTQQFRSHSDYDNAIIFARKILAFDKTNERAYQHLMFCYMTQGDRSSAIRQYGICQRVLLEELGVEPMPATIALYEWIKDAPAEIKPFEARISNLPVPHTSFIGRGREIAEVKQLLTSTELLTLTGAGGSGKTRLAIQFATDQLDAFNDGVWWVNLAPLRDETQVLQTTAKALGVQEIANQNLRDTLVNYLRSKQLLLILDNCEHLIETCAQVVTYLLESCPQLKIISTSREPLNISYETPWSVPTMSLPDLDQMPIVDLMMDYEAIRLFVERSAAINPNFGITDDNAPYIAQICQRLDGIPLAIELAAAKVKTMSVEKITARLN
ncbi:MAG: BTAD domain-containing putative transcriptional regulator, partial [Anaerolineales bacterium]|nr:BTAD domain-containing putative transcriptional regulator [Anaerolineales bacterium]